MAEASFGLQRLASDLASNNVQVIETAFLSSARGGSVSLTEVPAILENLSTEYAMQLDSVVTAFDRSSPQSKRVSAVTFAEFLSVLRTWVESRQKELDGGEMSLQELLFDPRASKPASEARSERHEKVPSDSTLARADSPEIVASGKLQWALDYLNANKDSLRAEYAEGGPVKAAEAFFQRSGLQCSDAVLSRFDSLWLSASTLKSSAPEDEFEGVFVPTLSQFLTGRSTDGTEVTQQLIGKLEGTIRDVEAIEKTLKVTGQDPSDTQQLLRTLRAQLEQLQRSSRKKKGGKQQFQMRCERTLHDIYFFYAKQCKMIGKTPSFDEILHSTTTLTMGKFLKFLRDFGVLEAIKPKNKKVIDREAAKRAFKKTATLQKEMEEAQFKTALDLLALGLYDATFDVLNGTHIAGLGLPEKREMLYRQLELDDERKCAEKMKGYGVPFSSYTDNRIPPNDPAKSYKYRDYTHQRMSVEQWRNRIQGKKPSSNDPSQRALVVYKPFSSPEESPKRVRPVKKPIEQKAKSVGTSQEFFMTKALDEIDPAQLADVESDFDLKELIAEASSEDESLLSKQYPLKAAKPPIVPQRVEVLKKTEAKMEEEAVGRASKVTKAQMDRARKVQERIEASAAKYVN